MFVRTAQKIGHRALFVTAQGTPASSLVQRYTHPTLGPRSFTLLPVPRIGLGYSSAIHQISSIAERSIERDTPVKYPDGKLLITQKAIESVNRHKIGLKGPLIISSTGKGPQQTPNSDMPKESHGFTIPNILTMSRIATTPALGYFIWNGMHSYALTCFAFAALTDFLDGFLARRLGQHSALGAVLDPIADKLLMTTCFVALCHADLLPYWVVKGFILRDVIILTCGITLRYFGFSEKPSFKKFMNFKKYPTIGFEPTRTSKCNTALQCLLIGMSLSTTQLIGNPIYDWSMFSLEIITFLTTLTSLCQYASRIPLPEFLTKPPNIGGSKL